MNALHWAGRLYSLDTLDTRFTNAAKSNPQSETAGAVSENGRKRPTGHERASPQAQPSKWRTPEFGVYALVFAIAIPLMFKTVIDVSQPSHPGYVKFEDQLSTGWIPGRLVDNSDQQYASFRDNLPYLFLVVLLHPLLRRAFDSLVGGAGGTSNKKDQARVSGGSPYGIEQAVADRRLSLRVSFDFAFGLVFIAALHGFSALKVLLILYVNYMIATQLKKDYVPAATWIFDISILFANELARGYPYEWIASALLPWDNAASPEKSNENWGTQLDRYGGLVPRWEVLFNVTVLRLISFNMDYVWSLSRSGGSPLEKKQLDPANLSERERVDIPARAHDFSFRNYIAYVLYSPLYLAGPILTFNDYISQQRYVPRSISLQRSLLYGVRFLLALLSMELMIHYIYVVAISKSSPDWSIYTPFQLSMLGYFNLHHIWLKLLLPWRFFRFWSLIDGIDPPENVVRCMSDNYSAFAFWRGWHRSYNRWLVRYIYIPLGGSSSKSGGGTWAIIRSVRNMLAVFTFVAMWHDIQLRLLVWGWLITLFILPELTARYIFPPSKWKDRPDAYRVLCGIGAVGNILMMMAANLVGFALGLDGLKGLVVGIVGSYSGLVFLLAACGALFTGAQVMFELRQQELRQGINIKC